MDDVLLVYIRLYGYLYIATPYTAYKPHLAYKLPCFGLSEHKRVKDENSRCDTGCERVLGGRSHISCPHAISTDLPAYLQLCIALYPYTIHT